LKFHNNSKIRSRRGTPHHHRERAGRRGAGGPRLLLLLLPLLLLLLEGEPARVARPDWFRFAGNLRDTEVGPSLLPGRQEAVLSPGYLHRRCRCSTRRWTRWLAALPRLLLRRSVDLRRLERAVAGRSLFSLRQLAGKFRNFEISKFAGSGGSTQRMTRRQTDRQTDGLLRRSSVPPPVAAKIPVVVEGATKEGSAAAAKTIEASSRKAWIMTPRRHASPPEGGLETQAKQLPALELLWSRCCCCCRS